MKPLLKFTAFALLSGVIFFISCKKEKPISSLVIPLTSPPPLSDTLSGKEFIFDGLQWKLADFYGLGLDDIYVGTPARPDLFHNSIGLYYNLNLPNGKVYIKSEYSDNWIEITSSLFYQNGVSGPYLYDIIEPYLYVHAAYPLYYSLVGKRVSIKVKFL